MVFSQEYLAEFVDMGGQIFRREWLRYCDIDGSGTSAVVSMDGSQLIIGESQRHIAVDLAASTKEHADYTVVVVTGFDGTNLVVIDLLRRRLEGPDILPSIRTMQEKWDVPVVHIEKAGFQLALIQHARREGMAVKELRADRDKIARSLSLQARMEAGHVWLPRRSSWVSELERELLSFPNGGHDDQVDALSYAAIIVGRPRVKWAAY